MTATTQIVNPETNTNGSADETSIDYDKVEQYIKNLWSDKRKAELDFLKTQRGLKDETITRFMIGYHEKRGVYTFPVFDRLGDIVTLRFYQPNKHPKWLSMSGSHIALYPEPPLGDDIILCEGELDCLLARQNGFNAYTNTGGCGSWKSEWSQEFKGKAVTIVYDNDQPGASGMVNVAENLAGIASSIHLVQWPEFMNDKEDVTDFFVKYEMQPENFKDLLKQSNEYINAKTRKMPKDVRKVIPERGFINSYVSYAGSLMDSPTEFHLAVALTLIGAACGNSVTFRAWGSDVCLNVWTILIAPSGFFRKSTAGNCGLKLLNAAIPGLAFPNDFTREKFLEILSERPGGILPALEFKTLMDSLNTKYNEGSIALLTELYDCPDEYIRETKSASTPIKKPAISIMAASTVKWLKQNRSNLEGGFIPRFVPWPASEKTEWKGLVDTINHPLHESLKYFLEQVGQLQGRVTFPKDVTEIYNNWLKDHENGFNEDCINEDLLGFWTRLSTYCNKFAAICQIAMDHSLTVTPEAMKQAIAIVEFVKQRLLGVFDHIIADKNGETLMRIKSKIERHGEINRAALIKTLKMTSKEFDPFIKTLLETGEVVVDPQQTKGRTAEVYKVNKESDFSP